MPSPVRIVSAAVAHPMHWISQEESVEQLAALLGNRRRITALAHGSGIERRALVSPPEAIAGLGGTAERVGIYRREAAQLATAAAREVLANEEPSNIRCLATSSCTGCMLPGWPVELIGTLGLPLDIQRTPITEAGCAGGVVALTRAADFIAARTNGAALVVATELCSLAFHADADEGSLTSALLFGDGAGAFLLDGSAGPGLTIIDSASALIPCSQHLLGFDLTDYGFYPVLRRDLAEALAPAAAAAIRALLCRNGLAPDDVTAWLLHPGGPRILKAIEQEAAIPPGQLRWSYDSLRECGNMSSAAIADVVRRYLADDGAQPGFAVIAAFGPGVSIDLLLVRRQC